jgi:hypothetical protein
MWAAIAVSVLLVAVWGLSIEMWAGTLPSRNEEYGVIIDNGACSVRCYDQSDWRWRCDLDARQWWFQRKSPRDRRSAGFHFPLARNFGNTYVLVLPLWMPVLVSTSAAVFFWRFGGRVRDGKCKKCGYDLTGNVSGRCPECAEVVPQTQPQHGPRSGGRLG